MLVAGDAYRYTIHPVFENISGQRRCHIRRRPDGRRDALYEVFYYVQLPAAVASAAAGRASGFETPRVRRTIRPTDQEMTGDVGAASHRVDFLDVEHDAGLELQVVAFPSLPKASFTRYNLLSNQLSYRLSNPFDNRYDKTAVSCIQPVVKPVVQPGLTTVLNEQWLFVQHG